MNLTHDEHALLARAVADAYNYCTLHVQDLVADDDVAYTGQEAEDQRELYSDLLTKLSNFSTVTLGGQ